jgi:CBS domain-containing protein
VRHLKIDSEVKVSNLMEGEVITSTPGETLSKVVAKMSRRSFHELPIVDEKNGLKGFFSFDILLRRRNVQVSTKVEKLMVVPPKIDGKSSIFEAAKVMLETGFRAIPVVDRKDSLKGIISRTDIIKAVPKLRGAGEEVAEELMTPEPKVLSENDSMEKALALMLELWEVSAPVVDRNGKVAGSVLIDDIGRSMWHVEEGQYVGDVVGENDKSRIEIRAFVSPVAVVGKEATVSEICEKMTETNPYICVVADDSRIPIGIITQHDILKTLVRGTSKRGVYVDITGLDIDDPFVYSSIVSKVERFVKKIGSFRWIKPYNLTLHIVAYEKGGRRKWSVRGKFRTDRGLLYVKTHGWDILKCVDKIVEELNRKVVSLKPLRKLKTEEKV